MWILGQVYTTLEKWHRWPFSWCLYNSRSRVKIPTMPNEMSSRGFFEPGLPESGNIFGSGTFFLSRPHGAVSRKICIHTESLERRGVVESAVKTSWSLRIKWPKTEVEIQLAIFRLNNFSTAWNHCYHSTQTGLVRITHFAITLVCVKLPFWVFRL